MPTSYHNISDFKQKKKCDITLFNALPISENKDTAVAKSMQHAPKAATKEKKAMWNIKLESFEEE